MQKALFVAEVSSDKELVLKILFNNTVTNLYTWSSKETFERSIRFIQKGLQYAQELKRPDYAGLAHIRMSGIYRKRRLYTEATEQATQAVTALANTRSDSMKCILYMELGDIDLAKADHVPAYKNYNTAFHIGYNIKNIELQGMIYHRFSELYKALGNEETAKKYLIESLQLNNKNNYTEGKFRDYIDLARITNEREYIDKASTLANILGSDRYKLAAKRLLYYWYMVEVKNSDTTFNYLYANPDLVQFFKNTGPANFHWQMGNIFRYSGQYDSALYYYQLIEKEITSAYDAGFRFSVANAMADSYLQSHDSSNARHYFEKTLSYCRQINRLDSLPVIYYKLAMLSSSEKDFKMAYHYTVQADSANKLLQVNSAKDEVVLLQVDRENKKAEADLGEAAQKKSRKFNLQLMAITLVITGIFAFMLFIGMFAVSKTTIKMLGYFAFICLFEFIILVLDHPIIAITKGEPLKIWLIKIVLIALLVPLQHFLEHRLIRFLQSRKLLEARQRFSLKNWWYRLKKPAPVTDAGIEEDTAVL